MIIKRLDRRFLLYIIIVKYLSLCFLIFKMQHHFYATTLIIDHKRVSTTSEETSNIIGVLCFTLEPFPIWVHEKWEQGNGICFWFWKFTIYKHSFPKVEATMLNLTSLLLWMITFYSMKNLTFVCVRKHCCPFSMANSARCSCINVMVIITLKRWCFRPRVDTIPNLPTTHILLRTLSCCECVMLLSL